MAVDSLHLATLSDSDSEFRVLGICLDNHEYAHALFAEADESWWTDPDAHALFRSMKSAYDEMGNVDQTRVYNVLKQRIDGAGKLIRHALEYNLHPGEFRPSLDSVRDMHRRRNLFAASTAVRDAAYRMGNIDEVEGEALNAIISAIKQNETADITPIGDALSEVASDIRERYENGTIPAIDTGLVTLDGHVKGLRPGDLVVVGGRTGMGKTHLVVQLARHAARKQRKVWVCSLEMTAKDLAERIVQSESGVSGEDMWRLNETTYGRLCAALDPVSRLPVYITDKRGLTSDQICAMARVVQGQYGLDMIVVDYLSMIKSPGKHYEERHRIADIVKQLRDLAGEMQVPLVLVSQLNREAEKRTDHRPAMADLRESGVIEEHADVVMLLHRADYWHEEKLKHLPDLGGVMEIIVAKQRKGKSQKTAFVGFDGGRSRLYDLHEQRILDYLAAIRQIGS